LDERFSREPIVNLIGLIDQFVTRKAEDACFRRPAFLKESGDRVTEDDKPLARRDDHTLGTIAAVLVNGPNIVAKLSDPSRPF
jgi:hypothetical protein